MDCPACRNSIPKDDVNVATDIVLCRRCGRTFKFSELVELSISTFDLNKPPAGAWYRQHSDGFTMGASTRSALMLMLIVPFVAVWCGVLVAVLHVRPLVSGKFGLFSTLFGIPFLLGTALLLGITAMALMGKVEARKRGDRGEVFTGIGSLGWTRRFRWHDIQTIHQELSYFGRHRQMVVVLDGRTRIAFGSALSTTRRHFLLDGLRRLKFEGALE